MNNTIPTISAATLDRNIRETISALYNDPASYGRHGTKILDSVADYISALGEALKGVKIAAEERQVHSFYDTFESAVGPRFTREDVAGIVDAFAGDEWFAGKMFRALWTI